jgi:hypothetical protein
MLAGQRPALSRVTPHDSGFVVRSYSFDVWPFHQLPPWRPPAPESVRSRYLSPHHLPESQALPPVRRTCLKSAGFLRFCRDHLGLGHFGPKSQFIELTAFPDTLRHRKFASRETGR